MSAPNLLGGLPLNALTTKTNRRKQARGTPGNSGTCQISTSVTLIVAMVSWVLPNVHVWPFVRQLYLRMAVCRQLSTLAQA